MRIGGVVVSRQRICKFCGDLHEVARWPDNCKDNVPYQRSDYPSPALRHDRLPGGVNGMVNHADGRRYDSKSAYYAAVRASGCEIVGDDSSLRPSMLMDKEQRREPHEAEVAQAARQAVEQLTSDSLSNDDMANMMRAITPPAEEIIPSA